MFNLFSKNKYPQVPKEYCETFSDWTNIDTKIKHKLIRFTTINSVLIASSEAGYGWYGLYSTYRGNFFILNVFENGHQIFPLDKTGALQWLSDNKKQFGDNYYDVLAAFFDETLEIA